MPDSTKRECRKRILMRSLAPIHLRHPKDERWLHRERYVHMHVGNVGDEKDKKKMCANACSEEHH